MTSSQKNHPSIAVKPSLDVHMTDSEWWAKPLRELEAKKFETGLPPENEDDDRDQSTLVHRPNEITWFDKVLSYDYMAPVELAKDCKDSDAEYAF